MPNALAICASINGSSSRVMISRACSLTTVLAYFAPFLGPEFGRAPPRFCSNCSNRSYLWRSFFWVSFVPQDGPTGQSIELLQRCTVNWIACLNDSLVEALLAS
jgi:hypothetical protein